MENFNPARYFEKLVHIFGIQYNFELVALQN